MPQVIDMDSHRPHYVIQTADNNAHVVPVSLVDDIVSGKQPPEVLTEPVLRKIIAEWREAVAR